jgi:hypothetical protein
MNIIKRKIRRVVVVFSLNMIEPCLELSEKRYKRVVSESKFV